MQSYIPYHTIPISYHTIKVSDQIMLPLLDVHVHVHVHVVAGNMTMGSEEASPASISTCTTAGEAANSRVTAVLWWGDYVR